MIANCSGDTEVLRQHSLSKSQDKRGVIKTSGRVHQQLVFHSLTAQYVSDILTC